MAQKLTLQQIREIQDAAVKEMAGGKSAAEVAHDLAAGGIELRTAERIAANAEAECARTHGNSAAAARARITSAGLGVRRFDFIAGMTMIVLGAMLTLVSYWLAPPGGYYVFPGGFFIAGLALVGRAARNRSAETHTGRRRWFPK